MRLSYILFLFAVFSVVIPLITSIFYIRLLNIDMKILAALMLITTMVEGISFYLVKTELNYFWLQHIYTPLECICWMGIFFSWLRDKKIRTIITILCTGFILYCILNMLGHDNLKTTNDLPATLACLLFVGLCCFTLIYFQRKNKGLASIGYYYWIIAGLLLASAGSLAFFAFYRGMFSYPLYITHLVLNVISYGLYTIGIIWLGRRTSSGV